jgi:MoaA/NifB/PqqE/SkfB family radical SAM enzyme
MAPGVLLVQPPLDVSCDFVDYPYHCDLSVVQAAAVLRAAGRPVRVVDAFALPESGLHPAGEGRVLMGAPVSACLAAAETIPEGAGEPGVVVVAYTPFHRPPLRDATLAGLLAGLRSRWPDRPILLADLYQSGQHYVEVAGEAVLAAYPEVDAVLRHEAEALLDEICGDLVARGRPAPRWTRSGGEVDAVATLPVPAWDLVDLEARDAFHARVVTGLGRGPWAFPIDGRTLPVITSRGCPYRCAHCSSNPGRGEAPKRQRRHDEGSLSRLLDASIDRFGASRLAVLDEMVNVEPAHFEGLLDVLRAKNVRFDFPNGMRADHLRPGHLDVMAGRIATLSISAESGVQQVVDRVVDKRLDLSAIEAVVREAAARAIPTLVHFIIGMPGESREDVEATLAYARGLRSRYGAFPAVQYATPLPGTRLAQMHAQMHAVLHAAGAAPGSLPLIDDYNPVFQHTPVTRGEGFEPADLRALKAGLEAATAAEGPALPDTSVLWITGRSNDRCADEGGEDAPLDALLSAARTARRSGARWASIRGGEPTLHPRLLELVRKLRTLGFDEVEVITNGRRCAYPAFARALVRAGITRVSIRLLGEAGAAHDARAGEEGAHAQALRGAAHLRAVASVEQLPIVDVRVTGS